MEENTLVCLVNIWCLLASDYMVLIMNEQNGEICIQFFKYLFFL